MLRLIVLITFIFYQIQAHAITCKPVVAVYPSWNHSDSTMQALPWDRFTHIAVFGIYPNPDGSIVSEGADRFMATLVELAQSKDKITMASIGGAGEASKAFLKIAKDQNLRTKFAQNVGLYVRKNRLDGVDIDWEYWTFQNEQGKGGNDPVESKNLVKLLVEIRAALPKGKLLTTDIIAGSWLGEQYLPEIEEHVDYVNLMAFDFTGAWAESPVSHHSKYSTFKRAIEYSINRGFSKEKLIVGLPAYGKEFVDGENKEVNNISYNKIVDLLEGDYSKIKKGRSGDIYFETRENIKKKAKYLQENGLAGASFFEVTLDHQNQDLSLLKIASKALNPDSCYKN